MELDKEVTGFSDELDVRAIRLRYPEFKGQVAIVTGSARGIGKGIAIRLALEGMRVVVTGLEPGEVETTTAQLRELGTEVIGVPGDLGRTEDVNLLFEKTREAYGQLDLLVNNAAHLKRAHFFDVTENHLDLQLASNIRGPYLCAVRAAEMMRDSGKGGNIINISSVGGLRAHWWGLPYDVTKGALDSMTRAMALELSDFGIRVNAIAPGAIRSGRKFSAEHNPAVQEVTRRVPLSRFGTPQEIASAVAFLASEDGAYITGQVIYVDGGLVAQLNPRGYDI
ncbi:MAG: SDR family oxidoreductase [Chloroflexi bacterium]|nr:SDR family oxidoreductase [Chloroflexota bacterium]